LFSKYSYTPLASITANEYEDKKSAGHDKYLLPLLVTPVTFLRNDGNCTVLKMRCSACVMKRFNCVVEDTVDPFARYVSGNVFSV
jgi:hypothetical protein